MPRFNNGMGNRKGNRKGNGSGFGQGKGTGGGQGVNCRGNGQGFGFGAGNTGDIGQAPLGQRNPDFFRRFCLGLDNQPGSTINTRRGGILSAIDELQRQIDALKNSTNK